MDMTLDLSPTYEIRIQDVEYQPGLMATIYRPVGAGPFPALVEVHGGAWTSKDRTNNADTAKVLAKHGVVVMCTDFRMPPQTAYPGSLQDINLAVRWLKAHARDHGTAPERIGLYGTSSGGHQVLLAAMRPHDARYAALPGPSGIDASVAFTISGWGVLDPLDRYHLAQRLGKTELVKNHDKFWGSEAAMGEGSPPLMLARGEKVSLPPALVFQGTEDEFVTPAQAQAFAAAYRAAGGILELGLYEGEKHTFVNENPTSPNSKKAVESIVAFARKHGSGK